MSRNKPRRIRPWQIFGVILAMAIGGLVLYGLWPVITGESAKDERDVPEEPEAARSPVQVQVLERAEFPLRAEATGSLAPWRRADISAETGGRIVERPIEEGQWVTAGQVLVRLDDREQRIRLAEAEATLLQARADHAVGLSGSGEFSEADTTALSEARRQYREAQAALEAGNLLPSELAAARRRFEAFDLLAGNQREAVLAVTTNLTQGEQQVEQARLQLERTEVVAPFSGRIADLMDRSTGRYLEEGQNVGAGTKLLTLLDDRRMKVAVDVLEADLVHISQGATANVVVPSFSDEVLQGRVHAVNPRVEEGSGVGRVTVALANPGGQLVSGMYADVALEMQRLQDRMVVPKDAVIVRQGRDVVFLVKNNRSYWMYVDVGERSGDFVEIIRGDPPSIVEPGDTIVVIGNYALAHDVPVEVTDVLELGLQ